MVVPDIVVVLTFVVVVVEGLVVVVLDLLLEHGFGVSMHEHKVEIVAIACFKALDHADTLEFTDVVAAAALACALVLPGEFAVVVVVATGARFIFAAVVHFTG